MEIVIAVLLLIGAFTIGSHAENPEDAETTRRGVARTEQTTKGETAPRIDGPCRYSGGQPLQRDLTRPPHAQVPMGGVDIAPRAVAPGDD